MINSPEECTYVEICAVFDAKKCAARLKGCHIDLHDSDPWTPPRDGTAGYRFEEHTSKDKSCVVQYDIYVSEDGREQKFIYTLEVDGKEYVALYDRPHPIWA
jgi:hypothetical protein